MLPFAWRMDDGDTFNIAVVDGSMTIKELYEQVGASLADAVPLVLARCIADGSHITVADNTVFLLQIEFLTIEGKETQIFGFAGQRISYKFALHTRDKWRIMAVVGKA